MSSQFDEVMLPADDTMLASEDTGNQYLGTVNGAGSGSGYDVMSADNVYTHPHQVALFVVNLTLALLTVTLNSSLIYYISAQSKAQSTHNLCLLSMLVTEIIQGLFVVPNYIAVFRYDVGIKDDVTPITCKMNKYLGSWMRTVHVYSLLGMVLNRHGKVTHDKKETFMAGRCMFYLTFIWFSGAAYNVWQLVLNTSCYVPLVSNNSNMTFLLLGLPVYPPSHDQVGNAAPPMHDVMHDFSQPQLPLAASDEHEPQSIVDLMSSNDTDTSDELFTTYAHPVDSELIFVKQCGAYQHFKSFHLWFYIADILVIHAIPLITLLYLYSSMVAYAFKTNTYSEVQNMRRILMSLLLAVIFYICYLPLEFIDNKIVNSEMLTREQVNTRKVIETFTFLHGSLVVVVYMTCSKEVVSSLKKKIECHGSSAKHHSTQNMILGRENLTSNPKETYLSADAVAANEKEPCLKNEAGEMGDKTKQDSTATVTKTVGSGTCIQTAL